MTCPHCGNTQIQFLDAASKNAYVNYYRCEACACVWNQLKADPQGPAHIVNIDRGRVDLDPPRRKRA